MSFFEAQPKIPVRMNKRTMYKVMRDLNGDMLPLIATIPKAETSPRIRHQIFKTKLKLRQNMNSCYDGHLLTLNKINRDQRKMQQTMLRLHYDKLKFRKLEQAKSDAEKRKQIEEKRKRKLMRKVLDKFKENVAKQREKRVMVNNEVHIKETRACNTKKHDIGKNITNTSNKISQYENHNTLHKSKIVNVNVNNKCPNNYLENYKRSTKDLNEKNSNSKMEKGVHNLKDLKKDGFSINNNDGVNCEAKIDETTMKQIGTGVCAHTEKTSTTVLIAKKGGDPASATVIRKRQRAVSSHRKLSKHLTVIVVSELGDYLDTSTEERVKNLLKTSKRSLNGENMFDQEGLSASSNINAGYSGGLETKPTTAAPLQSESNNSTLKARRGFKDEKNARTKLTMETAPASPGEKMEEPNVNSKSLNRALATEKQLPSLKKRRIGRIRLPTEYLRGVVNELRSITEGGDGDAHNYSTADSYSFNPVPDEVPEKVRGIHPTHECKKHSSVNSKPNTLFLKEIKERYDPKAVEKKRLHDIRNETFFIYKRNDRGDIVQASLKPKLKSFLLPLEQERYDQRRAEYLRKLTKITEEQEQRIRDYIAKLPFTDDSESLSTRNNQEKSPKERFSRTSTSFSPGNIEKIARKSTTRSRTKSITKQSDYDSLKSCMYLRNVTRPPLDEQMSANHIKCTSWSRPKERRQRDVFSIR